MLSGLGLVSSQRSQRGVCAACAVRYIYIREVDDQNREHIIQKTKNKKRREAHRTQLLASSKCRQTDRPRTGMTRPEIINNIDNEEQNNRTEFVIVL